jgi:hypothetical protein
MKDGLCALVDLLTLSPPAEARWLFEIGRDHSADVPDLISDGQDSILTALEATLTGRDSILAAPDSISDAPEPIL